MDENILNIMTGIKDVASEILEKDISVVNGFSQRQMENLAKQTFIVKTSIATGKYNEKQMKFFLSELKLMAQNFVDTLNGIIKVTLEKLWNALVRYLYEVLGAVV